MKLVRTFPLYPIQIQDKTLHNFGIECVSNQKSKNISLKTVIQCSAYLKNEKLLHITLVYACMATITINQPMH